MSDITSPANKSTQSRNKGVSRKRVNHLKMSCTHGYACKNAPVALNNTVPLFNKKRSEHVDSGVKEGRLSYL